MLSKVIAGLVVAMAAGFAGYTFVHDSSGSHCCSGSLAVPTATEPSCCQESVPSCCESATAAEASCPALKTASTAKEPACCQSADKAKTAEDK
jgi:hypothetical protein